MNTRSSKLSLAAILDTSIGRLHVLATVIMTVHLQPPMEFAHGQISMNFQEFGGVLGTRFESYIGEQLRLIQNASVTPEIEYGNGSKSVDFFVQTPEVVLLVEAKSISPKEATRSGILPSAGGISSELDRASQQITKTAELIETGHESFRAFQGRQLRGVIVTREHYFNLAMPFINERILPASIPATILSAQEFEHALGALADHPDCGARLLNSMSPNLQPVGTALNPPLAAPNPMLGDMWDKWTDGWPQELVDPSTVGSPDQSPNGTAPQLELSAASSLRRTVSWTWQAHAEHLAQIEASLAGRRVTVPAVTIDAMAFHRMFTACKRTRQLVAENPIEPDYSGQHEAADAWPLITAAYNGIEQALKMLLLVPAHTGFTMKQLKNKPYKHDLEALYGALEPDDSGYIEEHFREHWSLNEYKRLNLGFDSATEFVAHLNKSQPQEGSLAWRYALLDMSVPIPKTNLWTMCEVWYAICCRIKAGMYGRQDDTFRLSGRLRFRFERVVLHWGEAYDGFTDDLNSWTGCSGDELGAWVDLLVKASSDAIDKVQAPERLRPQLRRMADRAIEALSREPVDPDVQQFLACVQRTDRNLTWNPDSAEFGWANNKEN